MNHYAYPKEITTAALAWRLMGRKDFQKHVVVFERVSEEDTLQTLLIKMSPWTRQEVEELKAFFQKPSDERWPDWPFRLAENPLNPKESFLSPVFYSGRFAERLTGEIPYRVNPATDDRPFFDFFRKKMGRLEPDSKLFVSEQMAWLLNSMMKRSVPMDVVQFFVTVFSSLAVSIIFLFIPLYHSEVGKGKWKRKGRTLTYFCCLGAGFIIFELTFIEIFMKLIGSPLYTYSVTLFTLLFSYLTIFVGSRLVTPLLIFHLGVWR